MEIVAECTGLHETVFLSLLILCFIGVKPMVRAKWAIYAVIFIFVENLTLHVCSVPLPYYFFILSSTFFKASGCDLLISIVPLYPSTTLFRLK